MTFSLVVTPSGNRPKDRPSPHKDRDSFQSWERASLKRSNNYSSSISEIEGLFILGFCEAHTIFFTGK
jgi:hypothetical protein